MNIFIAVPAYGGSIKTQCVNSIVSLIRALSDRGITTTFNTADSANIVFARNFLATTFLNGGESHILFSDADMAYQPKSVIKMIEANAPVVGCVYPKRSVDGGFVIWSDAQKSMEVKDGMADVGGVGMGLCLIARTAFEKLRPKVLTNKGERDVLGFFDPITTATGVLTEDFSFCRRWRDAGGKVRAILNEDIGHVGDFTYRGNYLDHLRASKAD